MRHAGKPLSSKPLQACLFLPLLPHELLAVLLPGGYSWANGQLPVTVMANCARPRRCAIKGAGAS